MKELLIFGAGGHSKVCIETAQSMGYKIKAVFDDDENKRGNKVVGISVIGGTRELLDNYPPNEYELFIAIGNNRTRMEKYEFFKNEGYEFATLIHPFSFVSKTVKIGENVLIMPGVVVNSSTIISDNVILNTSCSVDHDCRIMPHVHIAPGVNLAGSVFVGTGSFLGIGCKVIQEVKIANWNIVGAGAVVIEDTEDFGVYVGVPAKMIKNLKRV
ncbi:MAG: acetyltransferase [Thermotogae bacterium]|nr:acetyltransferase [Thermotogota bacterium]